MTKLMTNSSAMTHFTTSDSSHSLANGAICQIMSHHITSEDERENPTEKTSDKYPVISAEEFYGFSGPSEKTLKMLTSGNINEYFRHMNSQRQPHQSQGSKYLFFVLCGNQ